MGTRTSWARGVIAAGSLMAVIVAGVVAHAMLPSTAHQVSLWLGLGWSVAMTFALSVWHLREDGGRSKRHISAVVVGALAMIMTLQGVQGIVLVAIGEPKQATVVAERGLGSNDFRYQLRGSSGQAIPGELKDRFDRYNAGDQVTVTVDPRGILDPQELNVAAAKSWTMVSVALSLLAIVWCFFVGYTAPGPHTLRKASFRFKS